MNLNEANTLLASTSAEQRGMLMAAHTRYMHFTGVWSGSGFSETQIEADRIAYSDLLKFGEGGLPILSDVRCAEFMHRVCGLSIDLCMAYDEIEFFNEHGDCGALDVQTEKLHKLAESAAVEAQHAQLVGD